MTMKEKLEMHRRIEAENRRKLKEWKEIRELNERIAEEELQWFIEQGIIA